MVNLSIRVYLKHFKKVQVLEKFIMKFPFLCVFFIKSENDCVFPAEHQSQFGKIEYVCFVEVIKVLEINVLMASWNYYKIFMTIFMKKDEERQDVVGYVKKITFLVDNVKDHCPLTSKNRVAVQKCVK